MRKLKKVDYIVVHYSATYIHKSWNHQALIDCHKLRFGQCGYHFYVERDGSVYNTLNLEWQGCHCKYSNYNSIGVCYEGGLFEEGSWGDTRTFEQKNALDTLLRALKLIYPDAVVMGHYQMPHAHTACPGFDAQKEYEYISKFKVG